MTNYNIEFSNNSASARIVVTHENKTQTTKSIPLPELSNLIRDSSVSLAKESDTGFMSNYLIRESVVNGQVRRLYLYPTLSFTLRYDTYLPLTLRENNLYGFKREQDSEDDYNYLIIPNYTLRNFGMLIANANTEEFTCARHNFGCLTTDLFDNPNNESMLVTSLLNHFEHSVCWHRSFSRTLLDERNTILQGRLPYNYVGSNFNNDLSLPSYIKRSLIEEYKHKGLYSFLTNVFEGDAEDILNTLLDSDNFGKIILQYYFATIEKLKFEDYMECRSGHLVKDMM